MNSFFPLIYGINVSKAILGQGGNSWIEFCCTCDVICASGLLSVGDISLFILSYIVYFNFSLGWWWVDGKVGDVPKVVQGRKYLQS